MSTKGGAVRHRAHASGEACGTERYSRGAHLATLCRFDSIPRANALLGPFIPCERRLAYMEIWEIQGRAFQTGFLNREYGRPHQPNMVTLWIYD